MTCRHNDVRAGLREPLRNTIPDATVTARHNCYFTGQIKIGCHAQAPALPWRVVGGGGTPSYLPRASTCDVSVTVVSAVATATEPYSGQRRFQVSTSPSACSACTPHISKCTRMAS